MKREVFTDAKRATGSTQLVSFSLGVVYIWFGMLKFFPGLSPAEELATETIRLLTFDLLPEGYAMPLLALWETLAGLLLMLPVMHRIAVPLALTHIFLTFTPLIFFPEQAFSGSPFYLTLLGQYIAKNIILVSVLLFLWKEERRNQEKPLRWPVNQKARS